MKQIDKKDLPKLILLVVLTVVVFGYAAFAIVKPAQTNAATRPAGSQDDLTGTAGQIPAAVTQEAADTGMAIPTVGKDPFIPNGPAAIEPDPAGSGPVPYVAPLPQVPSLPSSGRRGMAGGPPNWTGPRSSYGVNPLPLPAPAGYGQGGPVAPVPVEPPPAPEYSVTGIVRGEMDVAILRGGAGGEERRFVRVGDPVGNGFVVAAIQADGVVIKSGDRRILLKLGDDSRAK